MAEEYYPCECGCVCVRPTGDRKPCHNCQRPLDTCYSLSGLLEHYPGFIEEASDQIDRFLDIARGRIIKRFQYVLDNLPRTDDGEPYIPFLDRRTFHCVYRYAAEEDENAGGWKAGECTQPLQEDIREAWEWMPQRDGTYWLIEEAEDECEVAGVYTSREAAQAKADELNGVAAAVDTTEGTEGTEDTEGKDAV